MKKFEEPGEFRAFAARLLEVARAETSGTRGHSAADDCVAASALAWAAGRIIRDIHDVDPVSADVVMSTVQRSFEAGSGAGPEEVLEVLVTAKGPVAQA